jgi:hypothetical protein
MSCQQQLYYSEVKKVNPPAAGVESNFPNFFNIFFTSGISFEVKHLVERVAEFIVYAVPGS